jgi:hypothetical protein
VNDKGTSTATLYTTMIQLVRERVYKFLSVDNMQAYTESNPSGMLLYYFILILHVPLAHIRTTIYIYSLERELNVLYFL